MSSPVLALLAFPRLFLFYLRAMNAMGGGESEKSAWFVKASQRPHQGFCLLVERLEKPCSRTFGP